MQHLLMPGLCQRSTRAPSRLGHSLRIGWGLFLSSIYFAHKMKVKKKRKKRKNISYFALLLHSQRNNQDPNKGRLPRPLHTYTRTHIATLSQNEILKCRFLKSLLMIFEPIRSETKTRIIKCCAEFRFWLLFYFDFLFHI